MPRQGHVKCLLSHPRPLGKSGRTGIKTPVQPAPASDSGMGSVGENAMTLVKL